MTKPIFQVINGGALGASEIDAAIAAIEFAPALERPAAEWLAGRAERDAFAAAEQVTAAVAVLAKTKTQLVAMLVAAGADQAAETHAALKAALVGADTLVAILKAAEVRFAIARAAAAHASDKTRLSNFRAPPSLGQAAARRGARSPTTKKSPRLVMAGAAANPVGGGRGGSESADPNNARSGPPFQSLGKKKAPWASRAWGLRPQPALSGSADLMNTRE
jgi:hypothetical protein